MQGGLRQPVSGGFREEIAAGRRFRFGRNWSRFLAVIDDVRIDEAARSLREMLGRERLEGLSFLDVGCGSGLFSLAARQLGARVFSFDYEPECVDCTRQLRRGHRGDDAEWSIEEASVLDADFMASLDRFDIVYAWGSLHHTGDVWRAMDLVAGRVKPGGVLNAMIYLDRGWRSVVWRGIKRVYCSSPAGMMAVLTIFLPYFVTRGGIEDLCMLRNPVRRYTDYKRTRGMSVVHDWIDWLGGYPYEFAKPAAVIRFMETRGFALQGRRGPEYAFRRTVD